VAVDELAWGQKGVDFFFSFVTLEKEQKLLRRKLPISPL
jgi:hypothetical protein